LIDDGVGKQVEAAVFDGDRVAVANHHAREDGRSGRAATDDSVSFEDVVQALLDAGVDVAFGEQGLVSAAEPHASGLFQRRTERRVVCRRTIPRAYEDDRCRST